MIQSAVTKRTTSAVSTIPSSRDDMTTRDSKSTENNTSSINSNHSTTFAFDKFVQLSILILTVFLEFSKDNDNDNISNTVTIKHALYILLVFTTGTLATYKRLDAFNFDFIYVIYLPFMLSVLFFDSMTLINLILPLNVINCSNLLKVQLQLLLLYVMDNNYKKFTIGFFAVFINSLFANFLTNIGELKSLDIIDCNIFSILLTNILYLNNFNYYDEKPIFYQVLQKTLISLFIVIILNFSLSKLLSYFKKINLHYTRTIVMLSNIVLLFPLIVCQFLNIKGQNPLFWLFDYILESKGRQTILVTWLSTLLILIPNVLMFKSSISLNTSRKVWHFLIIILLVYPFKFDPTFVKIALSGTIVLFLIVEYIRYLKLEPIGIQLDQSLRSFADFRDDNGPIIISYIYLIIGVSAPLLLADSPVGLISLGVGDSLASIVGSKWGRVRWPGTSKTLEGTVAFVLATTLTCYLLKEYLGYFGNISVTNLFNICAISGILEGNSVLNDNILIPSFMLISEKIFTDMY